MFLFAEDLKIYRDLKSFKDSKCLLADIDSVRQWSGENYVVLSIQKAEVISLTVKTNSIHFSYYYVSEVLIFRSHYERF
jgi:hypothetical protein